MIRHSDSSCSPDRFHRGGSTSSAYAAWSPWPACRRHLLLPVNTQMTENSALELVSDKQRTLHVALRSTHNCETWKYCHGNLLPCLSSRNHWEQTEVRSGVCGVLLHLTGPMVNVWVWMWWGNRRQWVRQWNLQRLLLAETLWILTLCSQAKATWLWVTMRSAGKRFQQHTLHSIYANSTVQSSKIAIPTQVQ